VHTSSRFKLSSRSPPTWRARGTSPAGGTTPVSPEEGIKLVISSRTRTRASITYRFFSRLLERLPVEFGAFLAFFNLALVVLDHGVPDGTELVWIRHLRWILSQPSVPEPNRATRNARTLVV
jgi:hypothetical protein